MYNLSNACALRGICVSSKTVHSWPWQDLKKAPFFFLFPSSHLWTAPCVCRVRLRQCVFIGGLTVWFVCLGISFCVFSPVLTALRVLLHIVPHLPPVSPGGLPVIRPSRCSFQLNISTCGLQTRISLHFPDCTFAWSWGGKLKQLPQKSYKCKKSIVWKNTLKKNVEIKANSGARPQLDKYWGFVASLSISYWCRRLSLTSGCNRLSTNCSVSYLFIIRRSKLQLQSGTYVCFNHNHDLSLNTCLHHAKQGTSEGHYPNPRRMRRARGGDRKIKPGVI